jgi:hypothetical protein
MTASCARERARTHLLEALSWSTDTEIKFPVMLSSSLGLAAPLVVGVLAGHPSLGVLTSLGSLMVRGVGQYLGATGHLRHIVTVLAPALCAWIASALIAKRGVLTTILTVLLGALAAVLSGYSRYAAVATARFMFSLIITVSVMGAVPHRIGAVTLMIVGALWTALLGLLLGAAAKAIDCLYRFGEAPETVELRRYSANQMRIRWRSSLSELSGWQYPLRIMIGLAIAACIASVWPGRHAQWIMVTVVLVTRRKLETTAVRTTQRVLGTVLGVIAASVLLGWNPPVWATAMLVALLGGFRPLLRARSYLLYSLVMTPLILLLLDFGRVTDIDLLWERPLATLIGAGLVLATGMIVSRLRAEQLTG